MKESTFLYQFEEIMKFKKSMAVLMSFSLLAAINAYAAPNTVTVTGQIVNNATKDINPPGWNYINARIYITNANDVQNVKVNDVNILSNGLYFNLYADSPANYLIDTTHLTGSVIIHTFDPNCNSVCEWQYFHGQIAPKLTAGGGNCTNSYNDLSIGKSCTIPPSKK